MALPKLDTPTYDLILPSTQEKVKYRPFLVKEYKILLTALDSDVEDIYKIVTDLVDVCTFNKLKVKDLPNFDIEYLFLNIRAKSIGEKTSLTLECNNCENKINFDLDITKAEIKRHADHTTKILITDKIGLEMRYPVFSEIVSIYDKFNSENIVELLCACIKTVYTDEEQFTEYTKEELIEFVNSFSKSQFEKLEQFFVTMPKVSQRVEQVCDKCNTNNEVSLEGLQNFFV
jgi:hypothetical protein